MRATAGSWRGCVFRPEEKPLSQRGSEQDLGILAVTTLRSTPLLLRWSRAGAICGGFVEVPGASRGFTSLRYGCETEG